MLVTDYDLFRCTDLLFGWFCWKIFVKWNIVTQFLCGSLFLCLGSFFVGCYRENLNDKLMLPYSSKIGDYCWGNSSEQIKNSSEKTKICSEPIIITSEITRRSYVYWINYSAVGKNLRPHRSKRLRVVISSSLAIRRDPHTVKDTETKAKRMPHSSHAII